MEETIFETKNTHPREEIADYLEQVSESLRAGRMTLVAGDEEITVEPSHEAVFGAEVERKKDDDGTTMCVEFEIEWQEGDEGTDTNVELE